MASASLLNFSIDAKDGWSEARATTFKTAHSLVQTPIFMPVATQAALRGVDTQTAEAIGFQVLLANTYHLMLRPGTQLFEQIGGIHKFMNWPATILTDSGGFQIFSLARQLAISEQGARFRSYVDGASVLLTPEVSISAQQAIGSDIMMVLDHCVDSTSDIEITRKAMELTALWAKRSFDARTNSTQALFGIVQGGSFPELRRESVNQICEIPFDGYAIGGLAVGEERGVREDLIEFTAPLLPGNKPRYLMGVGTPIDLLEAVRRGIDMFDCILPTSLAHQGVCFTSHGKVDLRRGIYSKVDAPLDAKCHCSTCTRFSRAYLCHLVRSGEFLADQLLGLHNLVFYRSLMVRIRESIIAGTFREFYHSERLILVQPDEDFPPVPPKQRARVNDMILGDYEVIVRDSGNGSIKQISSGEVMHSVIDPQEEARALYVDQSDVVACAALPGEPIVIWDVGLGAATNAMTCIMELERQVDGLRPIEIISFEKDLDPLKLALTHAWLFKHLRHGAPHQLLDSSIWENAPKNLKWSLIFGDFRESMTKASCPDIIWYDPFSFRVDTELWSAQVFRELLECCAAKASRVFTYSASTAVRAAMLAAGWYVGPGVGTGPKTETTIAYNQKAAAGVSGDSLLGARWLERWSRSDAKIPVGEEGLKLVEQVRAHPQFAVE
jgi:queuine tRNA-ribosyltransferase